MKQLGSELPGQKPLMTVDEYLGPFPPDGKFNGNRAPQAEGNLLAQKSFLLNEEPWEISFLQSIGVTLSASLDTEELLSGLFSILKKFFRGDVIAMEFAEKVASIGYVVSSDSVAPEILKEFSEHNSLSCFNESGKKLNGENCRTRYL
ncbi:MAG: hypothetical protein ACE5FU_03585, partial [Nitrospinota bacterium]